MKGHLLATYTYINLPVIAGRMIIVGSSGDEDDGRQQRGRGGAPPRPAQQPLSTDLANIVNAATSANNPRHPADLVRPNRQLMLMPGHCQHTTGHSTVGSIAFHKRRVCAGQNKDTASQRLGQC